VANNCTQLQSGQNVSYVTCRVGVQYSIFNTIYEKQYDYAGLGFMRNTTTSSTTIPLEYTWSPDSVGFYTPAT